jgi:Rrf2 family transcriptional regulator, repressor of oqxAB
MASGRFGMAVQMMAVLAQHETGATSAALAGLVGAHPVVLRRVLRRLAQAGLVETREGRGGGSVLTRRADRISLAEVYAAVEPEGPLALSLAPAGPQSPLGAGLRAAFAEVAAEARHTLLASLEDRTVADVARAAIEPGREARRRKR